MMSRRADTFERHFPDAYRLAFYLSSDERSAERAVISAFARCFARYEHLRADDLFEAALLGETWRAAVPRRHRRAEAELATRILEDMGLNATIATGIPRAADDHWTRPADGESLPDVEAIPAVGSLREAIRRARLRVAASLVVVMLLLSGGAWALMREEGALITPPVNSELPEVLPQSLEPRGPKVELVVGSLENKPWSVGAYAARYRSVCIELRVDATYGDVHCPSNFKIPLRAFVGADAKHQTTFLYGYARSDVTDIAVKVAGSPAVGVEIGRDPTALGFEEPGGFFAVTVPGYLLQLSDREQGRTLGYRVYKLRLIASGADGKRLGKQELLLGRP